jgi:two-component system phosphate regulon response regulator OmpR
MVRGPAGGGSMANEATVDYRVLLVDDDERLAEMVVPYLRGQGFSVEHRPDGIAGLDTLQGNSFDAVILDIMMPGIDGFETCRRIRASSDIPILILTARGDDTDRIVGLELGADDYLPKRTVLRFGELVIDKAAREARVHGRLCTLTSHQFALLVALAERAGRVQTRGEIMDAVRGEELEAFDRSIDVHISRIRAEIEDDPKQPKYIRTVRGAGYVFTPPSLTQVEE